MNAKKLMVAAAAGASALGAMANVIYVAPDGAGSGTSWADSADLSAGFERAVAAEGGAWTWASELIENPTRPSAKRLAVRFAKPVTAAEVAFAFTAK